MRRVHVQANLLHGKLNVWSGEREILKSTNNGPIEWSIRRGQALEGRNLGLRVNRSSNRMTVEHASTLKKLVRILLLMKKEAVRAPKDLNAKEIM